MSTIRIGIVGAGFAADFHTLAFREVKGAQAQVVAVTSRRPERAQAFAEKHEIPAAYETLDELLDEADVDVIDLCVPTNMHVPMAIQAARARKHVIVEKPLTGYCGEPGRPEPPRRPDNLVGPEACVENGRPDRIVGPTNGANDVSDKSVGPTNGANDVPDRIVGPTEDLIGETVDRRHMLESVMRSCNELERAIRESGVKFMYAENWVYAPAVQKARRLMEHSGGTVLRMVAEESHAGSHASYAKYWRLAGGGALLRTGSHPIGGVCYIKQAEGLAKFGEPIRPKRVMAETAFLTRIESFVNEPTKHLKTGLVDCEDWGAALITFEDGSVAEVCSSDVVLGGVYNHLDVFLSTGRIQCRINPNDSCMAYGPWEGAWGEEYLAEKISTRAGWNFASPDEHWASGYPQEMQDFVDCIAHDRDPLSGWTLARDVVAVIFAAYVSAAEGVRVELTAV